MKCTSFEFRCRVWLIALIFIFGFWAPWEHVAALHSLGFGGPERLHSTWIALTNLLSHTAGLDIISASNLVIGAAFVCALLGAMLRTWAAAYLGGEVVMSSRMHAGAVLADGPYRYLRNPLYVGLELYALSVAVLMPPSGAMFVLVAMTSLQLRLIGGEEAHLIAQLGEPYKAYLAAVPSLVPSIRPRVAASGIRPTWSHGWSQAFAAEFYLWGAAISIAALAWRYNAVLIAKGVIISYGLSLILRALVGPRKPLEQG